MAAQAKYPLQQVFDIINSGDPSSVWFSAVSRSINPVIQVYAVTDKPKSLTEAQKFILDGIKTLTPDNFVQRTLQWNDPKCVADVYGLIYDLRPWYVKFLIEDNVLEEISFHPPEKEITTVSGLVIPKGA